MASSSHPLSPLLGPLRYACAVDFAGARFCAADCPFYDVCGWNSSWWDYDYDDWS